MRVTNSMLAGNFLRDMRTNLNNMQKIQSQLTSGKEIRRPSDDPFKVARAMQLTSDIDANKQYNSNIKDSINWLDTTDTALGQAGNVLQRVRELVVSAGNAAYGSDERKAISDEVGEKIKEFGQIMNTNFDGKYVFAGTRGGSKPMGVDTTDPNNPKLTYIDKSGNTITAGEELTNITTGRMSTEISQGVTVEYNVPAGDVMEFTDPKDPTKTMKLQDIFSNIITDLNDPTKTTDLTNGDLGNITDAMNNILKVRSSVGAVQNRMDSAKSKNEDENFNMTDILSKTEDIDLTEKTMEFSNMQTVYMASLQTSAKVIQPTILDYLR